MSEQELKVLAGLIADRLSRAVQPEWLDPEQASVYTSLSEKYLEELRRLGRGPAFSKIGRLVRYSRRDLDNHMRGLPCSANPNS